MYSALIFLKNNIFIFDLVAFIIVAYSTIQCTTKGFVISLLSFSKWLIALIITIVLTPKLSPLISDYIQSKFIADIGLGSIIFVTCLLIVIYTSKIISGAVTWSGLGTIDKTFGLIFGIFKGYLICVCIFTLLNWFYPHQKWTIRTEHSFSFQIIYNGSKLLIKEFPNSENNYKEVKNIIKKI